MAIYIYIFFWGGGGGGEQINKYNKNKLLNKNIVWKELTRRKWMDELAL